MKISGFTFVRNGQSLGFPFIQSIRSILPICDEFIVNVGKSDDQTLAMIQAINDPKIKSVMIFPLAGQPEKTASNIQTFVKNN